MTRATAFSKMCADLEPAGWAAAADFLADAGDADGEKLWRRRAAYGFAVAGAISRFRSLGRLDVISGGGTRLQAWRRFGDRKVFFRVVCADGPYGSWHYVAKNRAVRVPAGGEAIRRAAFALADAASACEFVMARQPWRLEAAEFSQDALADWLIGVGFRDALPEPDEGPNARLSGVFLFGKQVYLEMCRAANVSRTVVNAWDVRPPGSGSLVGYYSANPLALYAGVRAWLVRRCPNARSEYPEVFRHRIETTF